MIKVENIEVWGFEHAIRGMRNPMNSWDKSDSTWVWDESDGRFDACMPVECSYLIGPNDLDLMKRLYKAGTEHRKYLRQIFVSMDITAPLYWWKEADTYKIGTVANSCSTMHKIAAKEFELDDFSHDRVSDDDVINWFLLTIDVLNKCRENYNNEKEPISKKRYWWNMIQMLPASYNQKRTVTMNYENVVTMIKQRTGHKLDEWKSFVKTLESLPYIGEIMSET